MYSDVLHSLFMIFLVCMPTLVVTVIDLKNKKATRIVCIVGAMMQIAAINLFFRNDKDTILLPIYCTIGMAVLFLTIFYTFKSKKGDIVEFYFIGTLVTLTMIMIEKIITTPTDYKIIFILYTAYFLLNIFYVKIGKIKNGSIAAMPLIYMSTFILFSMRVFC